MGVKGLAKCSFVYCKRKDAVIILIMHCFHPLISEEHWGLLLILDIKVEITFMGNKYYILVINMTMMLQTKPLNYHKV